VNRKHKQRLLMARLANHRRSPTAKGIGAKGIGAKAIGRFRDPQNPDEASPFGGGTGGGLELQCQPNCEQSVQIDGHIPGVFVDVPLSEIGHGACYTDEVRACEQKYGCTPTYDIQVQNVSGGPVNITYVTNHGEPGRGWSWDLDQGYDFSFEMESWKRRGLDKRWIWPNPQPIQPPGEIDATVLPNWSVAIFTSLGAKVPHVGGYRERLGELWWPEPGGPEIDCGDWIAEMTIEGKGGAVFIYIDCDDCIGPPIHFPDVPVPEQPPIPEDPYDRVQVERWKRKIDESTRRRLRRPQ